MVAGDSEFDDRPTAWLCPICLLMAPLRCSDGLPTGPESHAGVGRRSDRMHLHDAARIGWQYAPAPLSRPALPVTTVNSLEALVLVDALGLGAFQPAPDF